jgi:hypothetical protein
VRWRRAPASAQLATLPLSAALECLTPSLAERNALTYPPEALERKDGGVVEVELVFADARSAPAVRVLSQNAAASLEDTVLKHVKRFRVPCMPEGAEPVRLVQRFRFTPNDGRKVQWSLPQDEAEIRQMQALLCSVHITPGKLPEYPDESRRQEQQGQVIIRLRFSAATAEPRVEVVAHTGDSLMRQSVVDWAKGWRVPCLPADGAPMTMLKTFHSSLEGGSHVRLNDLTLRQLVGVAEDAPRPYALNQVGALGPSTDAAPAARPERQPLMTTSEITQWHLREKSRKNPIKAGRKRRARKSPLRNGKGDRQAGFRGCLGGVQ